MASLAGLENVEKIQKLLLLKLKADLWEEKYISREKKSLFS